MPAHPSSSVATPSVPDNCVKVLFIAGFHRSGSTLLDRMLGTIDHFFSTGELVVIWRKKRRQIPGEDYFCSCGQNINLCQFWTAVFEQAFSPSHDKVLAATERDLYGLISKWQIPPMLWAAVRSMEQTRKRAAIIDVLGRLYRAISYVSGARVIVDSSKAPGYAYLLAQIPQIDLRVIHLVRDSRAVAYSQSRPKPNPVTGGHTITRGALRSALYWDLNNLMVEFGPLTRLPFVTRVLYEDLVRNPQATLRRTLEKLELSEYGDLGFLGAGNKFEPGPGHLCFGNVMRHEGQRIQLIREDIAWRLKFPRRQRWLVASLSWPLLLRYGYPVL